jgi:hypothetical protein
LYFKDSNGSYDFKFFLKWWFYLMGIATIVGMICYVLYYRLNGKASYWTGLIPLITAAFVMMVFVMACNQVLYRVNALEDCKKLWNI